jgi:hypothetical protein
VLRGQRNGSPGRILGFLDRSRYYFFQVAPQLYSRVLTRLSKLYNIIADFRVGEVLGRSIGDPRIERLHPYPWVICNGISSLSAKYSFPLCSSKSWETGCLLRNSLTLLSKPLFHFIHPAALFFNLMNVQ